MELVRPVRRLISTFPIGLRPVVPSIALVIVTELRWLFAEKEQKKPLKGPFLPPLRTVLLKLNAQAAPGPNALRRATIIPPLPDPTLGRRIRGGDTITPLPGPLSPTNLLNLTESPPPPRRSVLGAGALETKCGGALLQGFFLTWFISV